MLDECSREIHVDKDFQTLDYYKNFYETIFVIYVSEELIDNKNLVSDLLQETKILITHGIKCIFVHGGGKQLAEILQGAPRNIESLQPSIPLPLMPSILDAVNEVNSLIINLCQTIELPHKVVAQAARGNKLLFHGEMGQVRLVNDLDIKVVLDSSTLAIVPSICIDDDGNSLYVHGEYLSAEVGRSLKSQKLVLISDSIGIQISTKKGIRKISFIDFHQLFTLLRRADQDGEFYIEDKMLQRIEVCLKAIAGDVKQVHLIEGSQGALLQEILTRTGVGTLVEYNSVLEIRFPAKENDLDAILALRDECSKSTTDAGVPLLKPRESHEISTTLQSTICLDHRGVTVGTAFFNPLDNDPQTALIEGFVIGENYQDSGYGKVLLKACLEIVWQHDFNRAVAVTASSQAKSLFRSESSSLIAEPALQYLELARGRFEKESHLLEAFLFQP